MFIAILFCAATTTAHSPIMAVSTATHNAVGIGDAENDHAFLSICECSAVVANALPALKQKADIITRGDHGAGVSELIDELVADDLLSREPLLSRHHILLGYDEYGIEVRLRAYGTQCARGGPTI